MLGGPSVRSWTNSGPSIEKIRTAASSAIPSRKAPGSSFLATRGGRPPGRLARHEVANLRRRIRAVRVSREEGVAAALALGVSRASLHRWRLRYATEGLEGLLDQPRGPASGRLPDWVAQAVIVVSLLTYWNSKPRRRVHPAGHLSAQPSRGGRAVH